MEHTFKKNKTNKKKNKNRTFPYNYFVSPPQTKGMQPNASAVIVRRQLKPSLTQQGNGEGGGKPKQKSVGEQEEKQCGA